MHDCNILHPIKILFNLNTFGHSPLERHFHKLYIQLSSVVCVRIAAALNAEKLRGDDQCIIGFQVLYNRIPPACKSCVAEEARGRRR